MPIPKTISVHVERKVSKNYNSTSYSYGMEVELEDGDDVAVLFQEYTEKLRSEIRKAYSTKNGGEEA